MGAHRHSGTIWLLAVIAATTTVATAADAPWTTPTPGWSEPQAGEHPRLFFRRGDLAKLKQRMTTPEGQWILKRLRQTLDGGNGDSMPELNPNKGKGGLFLKAEFKDGVCVFPGKGGMTISHAAGFGFLWQLTGEKKYADHGRQCVQAMLDGTRCVDLRYAWVNPNGALRAGPTLGAMAMAYDLNYDGWDESFRLTVAKALEQGPPGSGLYSLDSLTNGRRLGPGSNHQGCQIGGGALACLALWNDPGIDNSKIKALLEDSQKIIIRHLTQGYGDGGDFWEGRGPGGISSDTSFIPAIQAWRVAGGRDFSVPRTNATAIFMDKVFSLMRINDVPWFAYGDAGGYGRGKFQPDDREGLSKGGQFAQGFGILPEALKPAALWAYQHVVDPDPAKRTYDTVSFYPHRAMLAFINWPIGISEANPATIIPKVMHDNIRGSYQFRNQWTGTPDDIVVYFGGAQTRDGGTLYIYGKGQRIENKGPKGAVTHFQPADDGSGTVTAAGYQLGVDYSKASGADALIVGCGGAAGGKGFTPISVGGTMLHIMQMGGKVETPKVEGDAVVIGNQRVRSDGKKIVFATMAGPPKLKRQGLWDWEITFGQGKAPAGDTGKPEKEE